jgi:hypothetical protein
MKGKRFSEEQIIRILHDAEALGNVRDVCRQLNIAEQTLYRWRRQCGGMEPVMDGCRESDRFIVPRKLSNKGRPMGPAEKVEGRERAKGNVAESTRSRTQRRGLMSHALSRVRQAPLGACT